MKHKEINLALLWSKYSGNVTSVNDIVLGLDKERFNVIFIFLRGDAWEKNALTEAGYEVLYLSDADKDGAFRFSGLFRLVRILKEHDVDVLHCHAHKATVYGAVAAMLAGTPVVLSHVHGLGRSRNLRRKLTNLLLFRKIDRIISVANSVKEDVLRNNWCLSAEKMAVLENSVDYGRFAGVSISKADAKQMLGLPADAFVFGTIARFGPYKGHDFLVSAFEKVKSKIPSAHLVLVGEGPLKEDAQRQAAAAGIDQSVHFLGQRNDIPELLRAMDVFVLPSTGSEGMPRAILEAMAAGVPCIATETGGIPEIINGQDVGFLVKPRDSEVLAQRMINIANMPGDKLREIVERARERIRSNFSHDVVTKKLENIYEMEINLHYESNRRQKSNV